MNLARRLMERHNLDQAVLMQERGDGSLNNFSMSGADGNEEDLYQGGIVTTNIRNRKTQKPLSSISRLQKNLVCTISFIFNVENYNLNVVHNKKWANLQPPFMAYVQMSSLPHTRSRLQVRDAH